MTPTYLLGTEGCCAVEELAADDGEGNNKPQLRRMLQATVELPLKVAVVEAGGVSVTAAC